MVAMDETIQFEHLPAQRTAHVRVRTPVDKLPEVLGRSYGQIMDLMREQGMQVAGPPYTAYFNLNMQDLDVEIGFPVDEIINGQGGVLPGEIAAGKYATCIHIGPYSEMEPTYNKLNAWIEAQGAKPAGIAYEQYLNGPDEVSEAELMTKILLPITDH
jgi:effector-binding domain-containing protein